MIREYEDIILKRTCDYYKIYKKSKIICENLFGGDCAHEIYCEKKCNNPNKFCKTCKIYLCGCCYVQCYREKCPSCLIVI